LPAANPFSQLAAVEAISVCFDPYYIRPAGEEPSVEIIVRQLAAWSVRGLFYLGLFLLVIVGQVGITAILRQQGMGPSLSLAAAGGAVLAIVILALLSYNALANWYWRRRDAQRAALGLPDGPVCAIWKWRPPTELPWVSLKPFHARFPPIAKSFGIEGFAIIEFEIGSDGKAKNLNAVEFWPARIFHDAAAEALTEAEFRPRQGMTPRFGESYQLGFVFRILGAARVRDPGRRARRLRPRFAQARKALTGS
jgi:hypothetical protein